MLYPCPQHQSASTAVIPTGDPRFLRIEVEGSWHHFKFTHHSSRERHVSVPEFTPSLCHFVTRLYYHFNQLSRNLSNSRSPKPASSPRQVWSLPLTRPYLQDTTISPPASWITTSPPSIIASASVAAISLRSVARIPTTITKTSA